MRYPYYETSTSRQAQHEQSVNNEKVAQIIELLGSEQLKQMVLDGDVTFGLIRPELKGTTINTKGSDVDIAERIEEDIKGIAVLAKFSVNLDQQAYEGIYGQMQGLLSQRAPASTRSFANRWVEMGVANTDGPSTVLLLHSPNHDAVQLWRDQVGHYDVENNRDISKLRGRYAKSNYSNVIHSSDSPESAVTEIGVIKDCLERSLEQSPAS